MAHLQKKTRDQWLICRKRPIMNGSLAEKNLNDLTPSMVMAQVPGARHLFRKRAYFRKRALLPRKRAIYFRSSALCFRKRTLELMANFDEQALELVANLRKDKSWGGYD